jgi:hypothetical protein
MQNIGISESQGHKFLFLRDFTEESYVALDYLIKFVKSIGGQIELFHISNSIDSNIEAGPINVLTSITKEKVIIRKKFKVIIEMIEVENIKTTASHVFGNFEMELKSKLSQENYIVVLGKNEHGFIRVSSNFLVNKYKGNLLILGQKSDFKSGNSIVIGGDQISLNNCDLCLPAFFSNAINTPVIVLQSNINEDININLSLKFPENENTEVYYQSLNHKRMLDGLKEFINNNQVELLCICRNKANDSRLNRLVKSRKTTKEIVNSINTPLLIMAEK